MNDWWRLSKKSKALRLRSGMLSAIRCFFETRGYLEIETPNRLPAPAPERHIDGIRSEEWFLQTSPELCMKRLVASGYESIFQISKCYRRNERGRRHIPEFTMLEWYRAKADYCDLMRECEDMLFFVTERIFGKSSFVFQGQTIDVNAPWDRISVRQAFERYSTMSADATDEADCFDLFMTRDIEPNLGMTKPIFLYDYPASRASLARLKKDDSRTAERFELYIKGVELANGFSELIDAAEQRYRFEHEMKARHDTGKEAYPMPEKFLDALARMPETAGIALGIDRLAMVLSDASSIGDVVAFAPEEL